MVSEASIEFSEGIAQWLVEACGEAELFGFLNAHPLLLDQVFRGGFKIAPQSLSRPPLRKRIALALAHGATLPQTFLAETAGPWREACEALCALDGEWLKRQWRDLLRGTGDPAYVVAMAMDSRPELARRGRGLLRRRGILAALTPPVPARLPPALARLRGEGEARAAPDLPGVPGGEGKVDTLERQIVSLRQALERQRERTRELEAALKQASTDGSDRERDLRRDLRLARQAIEDLRGTMDRQVAERVTDFKRRALALPDASFQPPATASGDVESLLQRVEALIEQQGRVDEAFGTREEIRRQIRRLAEAARRLAVCMDESIRVLPEVRALHASVCREIDRLQGFVPGEVDAVDLPELAAQLVALAKMAALDAAGRQQLDRLEAFLGQELIAEVLGDTGLQRVRQAVALRRRLIAELTPPTAARDTPAPAPPQTREVWGVREVLQTGEFGRIRVFVDGYNVTKGTAALRDLEAAGGLAAARERLCHLCARRTGAFQSLEVVFDGQGPLSSREARDGVTVVFSNGLEESQNADEYLLRRLAASRSEGDSLWLVTDDRGLRADAELHCAAFVGAEDWYRYLVS
ncbi:MAG: NYN domain-containing protein [Lentisphaeria bacterium]|nr:NYN domain-containing protein [Lentisphaeria bacterium]